jgi:hypothetical protein
MVVVALSATFLFGFVLWGINEFTSLRGATSLLFSRVVLVFTCGAAVALLWILIRPWLTKKTMVLVGVVGTAAIILLACALDRYAPKLNTTVVKVFIRGWGTVDLAKRETYLTVDGRLLLRERKDIAHIAAACFLDKGLADPLDVPVQKSAVFDVTDGDIRITIPLDSEFVKPIPPTRLIYTLLSMPSGAKMNEISNTRQALAQGAAIIDSSGTIVSFGAPPPRAADSSDISISSVEIPVVEVSDQMMATIHFRNEGTATLSVEWYGSLFVSKTFPSQAVRRDLEETLWKQCVRSARTSRAKNITYQTVPPHIPLKWTFPDVFSPLTEEDVRALKRIRDPGAIYAMGLFRYVDTTGAHETEFCYFRIGQTDSVALCRNHNGPSVPTTF